VRIVVKMESEFIDRLSNILKVKEPKYRKLKYDEIILHLKESKKKKKIPNGYKLIKKYEMLKVCNVETLDVPINEGNQIKYYVHNEELFHVLHENHL